MEHELLKYIRSNLSNGGALLGGYLLGTLFFAATDGFFEKAIPEVSARFGIYSVILLFWTLYWVHYRGCIQKVKRGKVGVVIAISTEDVHEEKRLKADFISRLRDRISAEKLSDSIDLIVVNNHQAKQLQDPKAITNANKRVRAGYYVWGSVKRRNSPNVTYFLNMNGTVFHVPIPEHTRGQLIKDMDSVILKQIAFPEALEFQGFQYSADSSYLAVRYILGLAAYISGDPFLAQQMHLSLESDLEKINPLPQNLLRVKDKMPILLSDESLFQARIKYDSGDFEGAKVLLNDSLIKNPDNYPAKIFFSIIDFVHDNDASRSLDRLKKALPDRGKDEAVLYNLAFLQLWTGDYQLALKTCDRILNGDENDTIAIESEQFNLKLLQEGRFKPQLYFWLGVLNYRKKRNFPQADKHFEEFLRVASPDMDKLVAKTKQYQEDIKNEIGY